MTAREPSPLAPQLPPLAIRMPSMEINNWFGLAGPAGLPAEIREGLGELFSAIVNDPQTSRTMVQRGLLPLAETGTTFEQRIQRDRARWRDVVRANNIRVD